MKVLKFGGSSVATPDTILEVINILKGYFQSGQNFCVVFSAFGGVTDLLLKMSKQASQQDDEYLISYHQLVARHKSTLITLLKGHPNLDSIMFDLDENHASLSQLLHGVNLLGEASPRTIDHILSFGERNSAYIISKGLNYHGLNTDFLDARKIIKTDNKFNAANVNFNLSNQLIKNHFQTNPNIQIVTGFISSTSNNFTTTLGRGGSDYTASILGAALNASLIEIWTDVDGVLTADPRFVTSAFTIPQLNYSEAMEMSHFGAKVIYPPSLQPALSNEIPLVIKNTFNPKHSGTEVSKHGNPHSAPIKGISSISDIALLTLSGSGLVGVPGIAARLFGALASANINIILITQGSSEHSISFAVLPEDAHEANNTLTRSFEFEMQQNIIEPIRVELNLSIIAIIGDNMRYRPGIAGRLFSALGRNGINAVAVAQGSSERNVSVVVLNSDKSKSLNALHQTFFQSQSTILNVFIVGVGLIGKELLNQIIKQNPINRKKLNTDIRVVGIANSSKMYFDVQGIDLNQWRHVLDNSKLTSDLNLFVRTMVDYNLSNSIFVDNTAHQIVVNLYDSILDNSISISTPNKIAAASPYVQYDRLRKIARLRGVEFKYETAVGAGLPVLTTLRDLINSGDQILKIEGVLSGSMSYIFNNFTIDRKISDIIHKAIDLGFTEPDPREDLSGADVGRKILILVRESGIKLESIDIDLKNIIPEAMKQHCSVESFIMNMREMNPYFDTLLLEAAASGKVLRYIAQWDIHNGASVGLSAVDADSPFYALDGSDNMIVFTTNRYNDRPLVIRGPGAGAQVTAAGVFAEVMSVGRLIS